MADRVAGEIPCLVTGNLHNVRAEPLADGSWLDRCEECDETWVRNDSDNVQVYRIDGDALRELHAEDERLGLRFADPLDFDGSSDG